MLSNSIFGFIAKAMGFNASFWGLSAVAIAGGALFQFRMPETKQAEEPKQEAAVAGS
jgi:predicted MFS family arabinose efflux permease